MFARTPLIGDLRPGGRFLAKDVHDIGGAADIVHVLGEETAARPRSPISGVRANTSATSSSVN